MPNAIWEPIIGSGFDSIAGQRANWAQFNRGVESENIQRANQAEQTGNSWLSRMQQINQEAADRDFRAREAASTREDYLHDQQAQRDWQESQFTRGLAIQGQKATEEAARTKVMADNAQIAASNRRAQQEIKIAHQGTIFSNTYQPVREAFNNANGHFNTLDIENGALNAQLQAYKDKLENKQELTEAEQQQQAKLRKRQAEITPLLKQATVAKTTAEKAYNKLLLNIENSGFELDPQTGDLVHTETAKRFSYRPKVVAASVTYNPVMGSRQMADTVSMGPQFGALRQETPQATAPSSPPAPAPSAPSAATPGDYRSVDDVRAAVSSGELTPEEASQILQNQF